MNIERREELARLISDLADKINKHQPKTTWVVVKNEEMKFMIKKLNRKEEERLKTKLQLIPRLYIE